MPSESDSIIVRVTNISNFDFTGEMGARYGGRDFAIPAGKSLVCTLTVGDIIATHLARQIIIRQAPIRDEKELNGKGTDRPLWTPETLAALKAKILTREGEEPRQPVLSEADRQAAKIAELNKEFPETSAPDQIIGEDAPNTRGAAEEGQGPAVVYKDKAEVIQALKARGITHNPRDSKAKLEALLTPQE